MLRTPLLVLAALLAWSGRPLAAQCATQWLPGNQRPELLGQGLCSTQWDPDGAGPLPSRLVIGGSFLNVASLPRDRSLVTWDGSQWDSLADGPGTSGQVDALTVWNGQLVAGGNFNGAGVNAIATWNGSAWVPIGSGFSGACRALTIWNGNLVSVGVTSGSILAIVRVWNGTAWTTLPSPPLVQLPTAAVAFEGELCVAGSRGGQGLLERWNGTSWATSITATGGIECLAVRWVAIGAEVLYAGGSFTSIGGTSALRVANTVGGAFAWSAMGSGLSSTCRALHVRSSGPLSFTLLAGTLTVMQFTSSSGAWVPMGTPALKSIEHYAGSYHGASSGTTAGVRYDGSSWVPLRGPGLDGAVHAVTRSGDATIVGGAFASTAGVALNHIARWDGATLQPLGSGMTGTSVDALLTLDNGDIVAGGQFPTAGGVTVNNLARWNGSTWSSFGTGFDQPVVALCKMPNGDVVAGGRFTTAGGVPCARIARWNGTAWSPLGSGMNGDVLALAVRSDGMVFAGGAFTTAGGNPCQRVARWNGTSWLLAGTGCNGDVHGLAVRPNNDVIAVGAFSSAGGVLMDRCARWNGLTWVTMGANGGDPSPVRAVFTLPNGDVVAGRAFHQAANPDEGISRWDGSTWSGLAGGLSSAIFSPLHVDVRALAQRADGALVVGGDFVVAGGFVTPSLATLRSSCMPLAQPFGNGCSGAGGQIVLTADTLPWIGPAFRTTTSGIAPGALCFGAIGFAQSAMPLAALLPQGQPGCTLLTSLDIAQILPSVGGIAQWHFPLPPDPLLIGMNFFEQSLVLELDGTGALVAVRSSNGLSALIGTL